MSDSKLTGMTATQAAEELRNFAPTNDCLRSTFTSEDILHLASLLEQGARSQIGLEDARDCLARQFGKRSYPVARAELALGLELKREWFDSCSDPDATYKDFMTCRAEYQLRLDTILDAARAGEKQEARHE